MARDGFLSRWSQKKLAERSPSQAENLPDEEPSVEPDDLSEQEASVPEALSPDVNEEPTLSDEELAALPKIEEITAQTDLQQFMRRGVPKALKLAAMRKMWTVNPVISTYLDEARDYAYDWNTPGGVPGSGGTIDLADAARRVERLLSGRKPPQSEEAIDSPTLDEPEPNPMPVAALQEPENAAESTSGDVATAPEQGETLVVEKSKPSDTQIAASAKRRHGSALPQGD